MATGLHSVPIALLFFLPPLPVMAAAHRLRLEAHCLITDAQQLIREQIGAAPDHRISGIRHSHPTDVEVICDGCIADILGDGLVLDHSH